MFSERNADPRIVRRAVQTDHFHCAGSESLPGPFIRRRELTLRLTELDGMQCQTVKYSGRRSGRLWANVLEHQLTMRDLPFVEHATIKELMVKRPHDWLWWYWMSQSIRPRAVGLPAIALEAYCVVPI